MPLPILPTTAAGSYPQPDWLSNRALRSNSVPRAPLPDLSPVAREYRAIRPRCATASRPTWRSVRDGGQLIV